jgi:hypothetical protein
MNESPCASEAVSHEGAIFVPLSMHQKADLAGSWSSANGHHAVTFGMVGDGRVCGRSSRLARPLIFAWS